MNSPHRIRTAKPTVNAGEFNECGALADAVAGYMQKTHRDYTPPTYTQSLLTGEGLSDRDHIQAGRTRCRHRQNGSKPWFYAA